MNGFNSAARFTRESPLSGALMALCSLHNGYAAFLKQEAIQILFDINKQKENTDCLGRLNFQNAKKSVTMNI